MLLEYIQPLASARARLGRHWPRVGAKLGAIRGGLLRMCMDADGREGCLFMAVWTAVDAHRRRLESYGSEGCGFKSCRARC